MGRLKKVLAALMLAAMILPLAVRAAQTEAQPGTVTAIREMDTLPGCWSPLSSPTAEKDFILELTMDKLYRLSEDGGTLTPSLAASMPEDVTADYAGDPRYGVPAGAVRGYAFRIRLNEKACWEDGTPITAGDYVYSAGMLLESELRRDALLILANAEGYLQGRERRTEHVVSLAQAGFGSVAEAQAAGFSEFYVDTTHYWGLDSGWRHISDTTRLRDHAMPAGLSEMYVTPAYLYENYLAEGGEFAYYQREFVGVSADRADVLAFADVGILKTGEYEITLVLAEPSTATALALELDGFYLLREALFGDTYGTSPEAYSACGPYRVVSADPYQILLEPNPNWYGDGEIPYDLVICR